LGADRPEVARIFGNMAQVYSLQGRFHRAEPLLKRALLLKEEALGPEHPDWRVTQGIMPKC